MSALGHEAMSTMKKGSLSRPTGHVQRVCRDALILTHRACVGLCWGWVATMVWPAACTNYHKHVERALMASQASHYTPITNAFQKQMMFLLGQVISPTYQSPNTLVAIFVATVGIAIFYCPEPPPATHAILFALMCVCFALAQAGAIEERMKKHL